jgi:hypothetical protein
MPNLPPDIDQVAQPTQKRLKNVINVNCHKKTGCLKQKRQCYCVTTRARGGRGEEVGVGYFVS